MASVARRGVGLYCSGTSVDIDLMEIPSEGYRFAWNPASEYPGDDWHAETVGSMPGTEAHNGSVPLVSTPEDHTPSSW